MAEIIHNSNYILLSATIFFTIFFLALLTNANAMIHNVASFGAKADGNTDASPAFLKAWIAACSSSKPSMIYVPLKKYLIGPTEFLGPCKNSNITFRIDGMLIAPDYKKMKFSAQHWITFNYVNGMSIIGGFLDGRGSSLYACKLAKKDCPAGSTDVVLEGVQIRAPDESLNTDGIHIQKASNVRVYDCGIKTGDDCISIGAGTRDLLIQRVACGPGHGISIGSLRHQLEEEGVQNVTVRSVVFTGTQSGMRIKFWARPSKGFVKGVVFKNAVMNNVLFPIVIDQNYCPGIEGCPTSNSGIQISQVTYSNIKGTSATEVAMKFDCSKSHPCKDIHVEDIKLVYRQEHQEKEGKPQQPATSFCRNVHGITRGSVFPPSCV
ncbi:polygalacturonase-like isoform X2 [Papaver somniferum]|uniref:polygalacturonase-like isoform X2 n=1 Tax=Papaver somniferum TaxID=3469 RepID=UPI000E704DAA|nr:polygalacturonase-like isoform X2 [Papaver somniferum]